MTRRSTAPRPQGPYPPDALVVEPEAMGLYGFACGVGAICQRCDTPFLAAKLRRDAICPSCRRHWRSWPLAPRGAN